MAFSQMGYLYVYFFFITWLPGYLRIERGMTNLDTGIVASLPFLMGIAGTIGGGWVGDFLIRSGVSKNSARKGMIAGGLMGATLFVVTAAFTTQTWLAVTLLTLCMGSLRMTTASSNSLSIDLAPKNALASLASIQSIGGNIGGLMAPILTGYILGATGSFVGALVFAGVMATFSACSMLFLVGHIGEEGDRMVLENRQQTTDQRPRPADTTEKRELSALLVPAPGGFDDGVKVGVIRYPAQFASDPS